MLVKHVLERKAGGLTTISGTKTIHDAAAQLALAKIGVLIVADDGGAMDGILSERDIVRAVAAQGPSALWKPVSDVMTQKVVTCTPDDTVNTVLDKMMGGNFRHMPVMTDGALTGMLSIRDLMHARNEMVEAENTALTGMIAGY
jgi:CBS domain-containing protein